MRLPFFPTLVVAAAVATMIGLGIWQLQRAQWKEALIAELEATDHYQPASLSCTIAGKPEVRAGRSADGRTGYRYLVPCGETILDIGWSQRPDAISTFQRSGTFTGVHAVGEPGARRILVLSEPIPPLRASGLPSPADLPNNHRIYAVQWFFFALAAAVIYFLALKRRQAR
jgi:surfeit locus 1 family protein